MPNGAAWSGSSVPVARAKQRQLEFVGIHRRTSSWHSSLLAAVLLAPFALRRLSRSPRRVVTPGLLRGLRPTRSPRAGDEPPPRPGWMPGRRQATQDGSHVHQTDRRSGRRPALPRQHRHGYAAGLHRGLPTGELAGFGVDPTLGSSRAAHRPISTRLEPASSFTGCRTLVSRVHLLTWLAGPAPSGSTGTSRRCRGCFPPSPASPGSGCPPLHQAAATAQQRPLTTTDTLGASWRTARPRRKLTRSSKSSWLFAIQRSRVSTV